MGTVTERTIYQLDVEGSAVKEIDRLEASLKANTKAWGGQAKRMKEVKTQGDELLDALKALGRRGNEAAAAIEKIADPSKRAEKAQAALASQLNSKKGMLGAAGRLEDSVHGLVASFKGLPMPLQAAAVSGFAVAGAAAIAAAAAVGAFVKASLEAAFESSPAMQIAAGDLRREYENLQKVFGEAILSGVDMEAVFESITGVVKDATKWIKENEDGIRELVDIIGTVGQVAAYVFSVTIPLALTPLLATIDGLNIGFKLWAAGASTALSLIVDGLHFLGIVSDETQVSMQRINDQAIKDVKEFESLTGKAWEAGGAMRDFGDKLADVTSKAKKTEEAVGGKGLAKAFADLNDRLTQLDDEINADHIKSIEGMALGYVKAGIDASFLEGVMRDLEAAVIDGTITAEQAKESFISLFDAAAGGGAPKKRKGGGTSVAQEQAARWIELERQVAIDRMKIAIDIENGLDDFRRERAEENERMRQEFIERDLEQRHQALSAIANAKREARRKELDEELQQKKELADLWKDTAKVLADSAGEATVAVGSLFGSMANGQATMQDLKEGVTSTVADMSKEMAEHFIKIAATWIALETGNPLLALGLAYGLRALAAAGASAIAATGKDSSRAADRAQSTAREARQERNDQKDRDQVAIQVHNYIGTREIAGEIRDMQERGLIQ